MLVVSWDEMMVPPTVVKKESSMVVTKVFLMDILMVDQTVCVMVHWMAVTTEVSTVVM